MKLVGLMMLLVAVAGSALAGGTVTPEIDPTSAIGALALLSGGVLVIRARRKKQ